MAAYDVLVLNEATPQIIVPTSSDTYNMPSPLAIAAGTATTAVSSLSITQTYNNAGVTFPGLVFNVTNTASAAASLLMDLQVGGVSQLSASKAGLLTITGKASIGAGTAGAPSIYATTNTTSGLVLYAAGTTGIAYAGSVKMYFDSGGTVYMPSTMALGWNNASSGDSAASDVGIARKAAGILSVDSTAAGNGLGALHMAERTAPAAPAANGVYIYAVDNGAGKTQLMAIFGSGAAQQIAIEP